MIKEGGSNPGRARILIVEVIPTIVDVLRLLLEGAEYEVATTNNGNMVERIMHYWHPDLVLLDLWIPGITGQEVCKKIKQQDTFCRVLLLMSAHHDLEALAELVGADGYLKKPFTRKVLLSTVSLALSQSAINQER